MEHVDEKTGENVWYTRFGGSNEPDQPWYDNTCGKKVKSLSNSEMLLGLIQFSSNICFIRISNATSIQLLGTRICLRVWAHKWKWIRSRR